MRVLVETRSECLPLNLEFADLAKPASQEASGILLLLSPGARIIHHTPTGLAFELDAGSLNSDPHS